MKEALTCPTLSKGRMLSRHLHATPSAATICPSTTTTATTTAAIISRRNLAVAWLSSSTLLGLGLAAAAAAQVRQPPEYDTLANIPQMLSGECPPSSPNDCRRPRIQRPKSKKAETCTRKCVTTCIRGGDGAPGEGPFNIRKPLVVFKQGFRSRQYCLVECSDICNLIGDQDSGP